MTTIGQRILRLEETGSTNTLILENEAYLSEPGLVVIARHQTAGRGRIGRRWLSLPGAQLQFSTVVHPALAPEELGLVSLVAGLSVAEAVELVVSLRPMLKWPNDVLAAGRKFCGILTESKPGARGQPRLVIGIGINCHGTDADFPPELRGLLITLQQASGREIDTEALFQAVLARLGENLAALEKGARSALLDRWRERAALAGRPVRFRAGKSANTGVAVDIDNEGRLLVHTEDGRAHALTSGEVEWLSGTAS